MLIKNRKYKDLDFTVATQKSNYDTLGYSYVINNFSSAVGLRTDTFDIANYHGSYTSETLAT